MIFDVLTLFPGMFAAPLGESILGKAQARGLVTVRLHNIRDFAFDKHQMTDDRPFGGGEGMVMKPEPIVAALRAVEELGPPSRVILLSPQGRLFNQRQAWELSRLSRVVFVCGRYEGVDERVAAQYVHDEISIGDFVLTGGELAAMVVIDAVTRLIPGVLGNEASPVTESFADLLLEHPQYTRPQEFEGYRVPAVLLSGNHAFIARWRRAAALLRTKLRRPDLFARLQLTPEDQRLLHWAESQDLEGADEGGAGREVHADVA